MKYREGDNLKTIKLDNGKGQIKIQIPNGVTYEIISPMEIKPSKNSNQILKEAFDKPVSSESLKDLAFGKEKIVIIVCDNTRYLPQKEILPFVLEELRRANIPKEYIEIIIATGTHDPMTLEEIKEMLGKDITDQYTVTNHNAYDESNLVFLGNSRKLKVPIYLNKTVVEADLRIGIGTVDPHIFAGYSGGNKILSVGVAGVESIAQTHNPKVMEDKNTKFGDIENNTFRDFINEVASIVKIDFLINVVQNSKKELISAFTGDAILAYGEAVKAAKRMYEVKVERQGDIVITIPKYPKTLNLYQAIRSINSVVLFKKPIVKEGGTVVLPAECWKGIGSEDFHDDLARVSRPIEYIEKSRKVGFPPEGNKAFTVAKMLNYCKIVVTDTKLEEGKLNAMHIGYAKTATEALKNSIETLGKPIHVLILTDGFLTLPVLE